MGFRVRKSIQIIPGVRMNISRSGVGYSVGGKGMRVTRQANGRVTRTVGIPGTGVSHQSTLRSATSSRSGNRAPAARSNARATAPLPPPPPPPAHPAMFAPAWEKDLFKAINATPFQGFAKISRAHGREHPDVRVLAAALDGIMRFATGDPSQHEPARALIGWAITQGVVLKTHPFVLKYLAAATWPVEIANGVVVHLGIEHDVLLLAVAELHQEAGDLEAAIWTVEQAEPTAPAALSLIELYSEAGRHQGVVDMTNGLTNVDDATALVMALRGRSFSELGYNDAAREALKEALRVKSRAPEVRHRALIERAQVNLKQNRKAAARKDLEMVMAEDPAYPGLADLLATLPPSPAR